MAEILIVEDDLETRETLREVLLGLGHQPRVASDGEDGLRRIDEHIPDLVVLDIEMPVLTGPDMAYRMFVHDVGQDEVPIVLLSGVPELGAVAAQVGTPYFLSKPFKLETLVALLNRALEERRPPVPSVALAPGHG